MAGVVNHCRHCDETLYDEETSYKNCKYCGKPDWSIYFREEKKEEKKLAPFLSASPFLGAQTVTIYNVIEMADAEGRSWKTIETCFDEQSAKSFIGSSGYKRIEKKEVFMKPDILKGISVNDFEALPRYPVSQALKDREVLDKIKNKLAPEEMAFLARYYKGS